MKDINTLEIRTSSTAVEAYNMMRSKSETSLFEAARTLEALSRVQTNKLLLEKVREEGKTDD